MNNRIRNLALSTAIVLALPLVLGGCATTSDQQDFSSPEGSLDSIAKAFSAGHFDEARETLETLTALRPTDPVRQTLLAMTWQSEQADDPQAQDLALVGYRTALSLQPAAYWPAILAGQISLNRGQYDDASKFFAQAIISDPDSVDGFIGLATASYLSGDIVLANEAARRATQLDEDARPAWRLAALTSAALSLRDESNRAINAYQQLGGADVSGLQSRAGMLVRTAALDETADNSFEPYTSLRSANQVAVDVTILLSQNTHRDRVGLNLLDGLRLQYGALGQRTVSNTPGSGTFDSQTTFTQALTLPDINWNLNLFNRFGQYYQVAARPSLTAFLGTPSEFFVGRSLQIGVRGIDSGRIEQVDIGINLKVTPIEIREDSVIVQIETGRSFVTTDPAGTFAEQLSTFRQSVSATAEVRYGETLVLSGLSESVRDATGSKVPGVGEVPVLGSLFNERSTTERRDAVLVFVTPSEPISFSSRPWMRPDTVRKLISLWDTVVDPSTNGTDVVARLSSVRMFSRMQPGDAPLQWGPPAEQMNDALHSLLNLPN